MNIIEGMQNEMNFYDHCNEFVYNHDFVIFLLFGVNNFTIYKIIAISDNALVFICNIITF